MRASKILGLIVMVSQLAGIILFAVSTYSLITVVESSVTTEAGGIEATIDEATGRVRLSLTATPTNPGYLGVDLSVSLGLIDENGQYLAVNSTSLHLDPGEARLLNLQLSAALSEVIDYFDGSKEGFIEMKVDVRTLNNLVGFSNTLRVRGGQQ